MYHCIEDVRKNEYSINIARKKKAKYSTQSKMKQNKTWTPHLVGHDAIILLRSVLQYFIKFRSFTHWGRVTHICVSNLIITDSDTDLSPGRRWTNAGILPNGPSGTNPSEIPIKIYTCSFKKIHSKTPSGNGDPPVSVPMSQAINASVIRIKISK